MLNDRIAVRLLRLGTPALLPLEWRSLRAASSNYPAPIFIVGPPRSGTTLLYRLLTEAFSTAHFVRLSAALPKAPVTATKLARRLRLENSAGEVRNHYGQSIGWGSPHEAGVVWRRWFPTEDPDAVGLRGRKEDVSSLRATIAAMSAAAGGAPLVSKNLSNSYFLPDLTDALGPSLILQCRRDPVETALSILQGRFDNSSNADHWWSIRPPGWRKAAEGSVEDQIAYQIAATYDAIDNARLRLESRGSRIFDADYVGFASEPERFVETIAAEYESLSIHHLVRSGRKVPETKPRTRVAISPQERRLACHMKRSQ
jgi:hypothetical protein